MKHEIITNNELGHAYFYFESKSGRLFLAKQIMTELGYKGVGDTLRNYDLIDGSDFVKFYKRNDKPLFDQLFDLKSIGLKSSEVIMLTESGFWKLVMQSRKSIGIKTRHWLASEVLPSIRKTGSFGVAASSPLAMFTERNKQVAISKAVNSSISTGSGEYYKFWNELHLLVTGMDAKTIKALYKSKGSAKEVLRVHLPHLEATESMIEDLWRQGIGFDKIRDTGLHESLSTSFRILLDFGIDLKELGK